MNRILVSSLIFVLLSSLSHSQRVTARFPGRPSELPSPNGRYALINVDRDLEPYHSIFLKEKTTGQTHKIIDYPRSSSVIWAPDSQHFGINDYAGSNYANAYISAVDRSVPRVDLQEEISRRIKGFTKGNHEYLGIVRWMDHQRVVVHHWGHNDSQPRAYCECLIYNLDGSVKYCATQPNGSDPEKECGTSTP